MNLKPQSASSWVYRSPSLLACFLLGICLVLSQLDPCDATSVSAGGSFTFISLALGVGFLVALDSAIQTTEPTKPISFAAIGCIAFGIWVCVCTWMVPSRGNARFAFNGCWQWVGEISLLLSIARLSMRGHLAGTIVSLMIACAAGTVGHAMFQFWVTAPALRARFVVERSAILSEMGVVDGTAQAMQFASRLQSTEPTGPFALTNSLAGFMAAWSVFLLVMLCSHFARPSRSQQQGRLSRLTPAKNGPWIGLAMIATGMFVVLLLTKSRSAWLATAIGLVAATLLHPALRHRGSTLLRRYGVTIGTAAVIVSITFGVVIVRDPTIVSEAGKSLSYRLDYWQGAIALIRSHPWTGVGVCNFQQNYNQVKSMAASESPADPHNFLMETATAGGLPLLFLLLGAITLFCRVALESVQRYPKKIPENGLDQGSNPLDVEPANRYGLLVGGAIACLASLCFHAFFRDDLGGLASTAIFVLLGVVSYAIVELCRRMLAVEDTAILCVIAASITLLHLLASGGWMQPGVMNTLCVASGILLGTVPKNGSHTGLGHRDFAPVMSAIARFAPILLIGMASIGFLQTSLNPVVRSATITGLMTPAWMRSMSVEEWSRVVESDPYDPELPRLAANACVEMLVRNELSTEARKRWLASFDGFAEEFVRRDPVQWAAPFECGQWNTKIAASAPNASGMVSPTDRKEQAFRDFERSATLFPNSVQTQLQAAVGAAAIGRWLEMGRYLEMAEAIDRVTPHLDRKINATVVYLPIRLETEQPLDRSAREGQEPGFAKGEPVVQWMRRLVP